MESANKIKKQINAICKQIEETNIFNKNKRPTYKSMDFLQKKHLELTNKIDSLFRIVQFKNGERIDKSKELKLEHYKVKDVLIQFLGDEIFIRNDRKHNNTIVRFCCMYFLHRYSKLPLKDIGCMFRPIFDHSSVIHGIETFKDILQKDEHWQIISKQIQTKLEQNVLTKLEQLRSLADAEVRQHNANTTESIHY